MKQKRKENKPVTIHYRPEHALSVIYWSVTLFLVCLCIIISCEVQRVTIAAVIFGILSAFFIFWPLYRRVSFKHNGLWVYSLIPGRSAGCHYNEIAQIKQRGNHFTIITQTGKTWNMYINKKKVAQFIKLLQANHVQVEEQ